MSQRQNVFDENRNIEKMVPPTTEEQISQLEQMIRQLECVVSQQQQQNQLQLQQIQQYESQLQQRQTMEQPSQSSNDLNYLFSPKDVIDQFRRLKPFDGKYLMQFIASVEATIKICNQNMHLIEYGVQIVCNEKILEDAGHLVRQLGPQPSWCQVKERLMHNFKPKRSYSDIFSYCRYVKVWNLSELFSTFEKAKFELGEIYDFDESKPGIYSPYNVDRDLVNLMLGKIDAPFRTYVQGDETMLQIITKYSKLGLLDDKRAIDYRHKKKIHDESPITNQNTNLINSRDNTENNFNRYSKNSNRTYNNFNNNNNNNSNYNNNNSSNPNSNHRKPSYNQNTYDSYNYGQNNNGINNTNYNSRRENQNQSNRTRISHMSVDREDQFKDDMVMDITTGEEGEVNFLTLPLDVSYQ